MKYFLLIFVCGLLLVSCRGDKRAVKVVAAETKELGMRKVILEKSLHPQSMTVVDSLLVVQDIITPTNFLFHVYSLHDYHYCYSFGRKGQGPEEFSMPILQKKATEGKLLIYDFGKRKISEFFLGTKAATLVREQTLKEDLFEDTEVFSFVGNGYYAGIPENGKGALFFYHLDNNKVHYSGFYPEKPKNVAKKCIPYYYNARIAACNDTVVAAMLLFPEIHFYNRDGEHLQSISFEEEKYHNKAPEACKGLETYTNNTVFHYIDICTDKNKYYALYLGKTDAYYEGLSAEQLGSCEVHCFDNNLKITEKKKLPALVKNIAINPYNGAILGLSGIEEEAYLYSFEF